MLVIQLTKYGKPEEGFRLAEIAEPDHPGSGQILIRVEYAPINDSDLLLASGLYVDIVLLAGPNTAAEANRVTGGALVRLALDGVSGDATGTLLDIVGWDARIVCYAAPTREPIKVNPLGLVAKRASIHPFFMHYPENLPKLPEKIRSAAELVATHQLRVPIAAVYSARRFKQALAHALAGGKVLIDFTDESLQTMALRVKGAM